MERCTNCGAPVRTGAKFCTTCGFRLTIPTLSPASVERHEPGRFDPRGAFGSLPASEGEAGEPDRDDAAAALAVDPESAANAGGDRVNVVDPGSQEDHWAAALDPASGSDGADWRAPEAVASWPMGDHAGEAAAAIAESPAAADRSNPAGGTGTPAEPATAASPQSDNPVGAEPTDETVPAPPAWSRTEAAPERDEERTTGAAAGAIAEAAAGDGAAPLNDAAVEGDDRPIAAEEPETVVGTDAEAEGEPRTEPRGSTVGSAADADRDADAGVDPLARANALLDELRALLPELQPQTAAPAVDLNAVADELAAARSEAADGSELGFEPLRSALATAREHPRDIDTMLDLVGRVDVMVALQTAHDRYAAAIDRAIATLRNGKDGTN